MPKLKTKSGAKKRLLLPELVKSKENAYKSHILTKKETKQREILRKLLMFIHLTRKAF